MVNVKKDISLIMNPIKPIKKTPKKQILIESQSSLRPGFFESLNSLEHDLRNDEKPKLTP